MPLTGRRTADPSLKTDNHRFSTFMPNTRHSEYLPRSSPSLDGIALSDAVLGRQSESALSATTSTPAPAPGRGLLRNPSDIKSKRFSLMRFRHASDPQLSKSYADSAIPPVPPVPPPPKIITTAPTSTASTMDSRTKPKKSRLKLLQRSPKSLPTNIPTKNGASREALATASKRSPSGYSISGPGLRDTHISFDEPSRSSTTSARAAVPGPPAYGEDANTALALPVTRLSESSRSDGSNDHGYFASTTTTTHTVSTTTTFFRLPRRKKDKPLFPLPAKSTPDMLTPRASQSERPSDSFNRLELNLDDPPLTALHNPLDLSHSGQDNPSPLPSPSHSLRSGVPRPLINSIPALARRDSNRSALSAGSSSSLQAPARLGQRGRSSTMNSLRRGETGLEGTPHMASGRNSTSTAGRKSFGDLFGLARLRQNPDGPNHGSPGIPGTPGSSKQNSFTLAREPEIKYPEREEGDTPALYLEKLQAAVNRGSVAAILSKTGDDFSHTALRRYMRSFHYFGEPIDMAIRKLLMEVELPKESQHIDRVLQGFADRYHECNPGIFASPDQAYFIAFSILILHTDVFNKNNKHNMQKPDYLRGTRDEGVSDDVLECFYDNISYTPFIHLEEGLELNSRLKPPKARKHIFPVRSPENVHQTSGPVDPYTLILDNKIDNLRPNLKDVMELDDSYNSLGLAESLDMEALHQKFTKSSILQIVSARSRPDAFMTALSTTNPADAQPGIVEIKVAKVGLLWRKDPRKKKKTRSPWAEWGAVLTSSQLYFFRDVAWVKSLMSQQEHQTKKLEKAGASSTPVVFKPPISDFRPDALMSTDDAVALWDKSYKKHKHGFVFVRHGGFEEVFLADDDAEMNDWIATLNYAAAFRTAGVRMKGFVGASYEGGKVEKGSESTESNITSKNVSTPTGEVSIKIRKMDPQLALDVMAARRMIMGTRISEAETKLAAAQGQHDLLLRNARHLQILTPIQNRSRDAVIMAAGRMSAKLKWIRLEFWRIKVHKELLALDLAGDREPDEEAVASPTSPVTPLSPKHSITAEKRVLTKLDSPASSPKSTHSLHSSRPLSSERDLTTDSINQVLTGTSTRRASIQESLTSLDHTSSVREKSADGRQSLIREESQSRPLMPNRYSAVSHRSSNLDNANFNEAASRLATPAPGEEGETQMLRDAGLISTDGTSTSKRPGTSSSNPEAVPENGTEEHKERRSRVRRSLHRTLRDSHGSHLPHHQRSRKGRESGSSLPTGEELASGGEVESLARKHGSFNFHGKKASVIQFGSEWHDMTPEERLKLHKQAHEDSRQNGTDPVEIDEFESLTSASFRGARTESVSTASVIAARRESVVSGDNEIFEDAREHTPLEEKSDGLASEGEEAAAVDMAEKEPDEPEEQKACEDGPGDTVLTEAGATT